MQSRHASQMRLALHQRCLIQQTQVIHPVLFGPVPNLCQFFNLFLIGRDNQLAEASVRHAVAFTIPVEHLLAPQAQVGLVAVPWIINAGMDDFTVSGTGLAADDVVLLDHQNVLPGQREVARHSQTNHPGTDNQRFNIMQGFGLPKFLRPAAKS